MQDSHSVGHLVMHFQSSMAQWDICCKRCKRMVF